MIIRDIIQPKLLIGSPIIYHRLFVFGIIPLKLYRLITQSLIRQLGLLSIFICAGDALALDATSQPLIFNKYRQADISIIIDGGLDEPIWKAQTAYDNMLVTDPDILKPGIYKTQTRFLYTEKGLYVGVWNEQDSATLVSRLSSRDRYINRDGISLTIDTSGEGLYAYWFNVNLGGSLIDGTVLPERQFSRQWDGAWQGAAAETEDGWSAEMFLPWSMMAMPQVSEHRKMGFYISRKVAYLDERWSWPALARTQSIFMSALQPFELEEIKPQQQFVFYPFGSSTFNNIEKETDYKSGFDIFWRPSSNMQLSATLNPDFGSVESDDVVINLTAFETFFPEKRAFFLEGNDIFITTPRSRVGGPGSSRSRPTTLVNTRRIGGKPRDPDVPDEVEFEGVELSQPSQLEGAVKITGQYKAFRYGILAAKEDDTKMDATVLGQNFRYLQDGRDFGVVRLLYENVSHGGRRSLGWISTMVSHPEANAVVHGVDAHLLSSDKKWLWDLQLMRSEVDNESGAGGFTDLEYNQSRGVKHKLSFDWLNDKLDINDLGFIRRNDAINFSYRFRLTESDLPKLRERDSSFRLFQGYNTDGEVIGSGLFFDRNWTFMNRSRLFADLNYFPKKWDDRNSDDNGTFRVEDRWQAKFFWKSDTAKVLAFGFGAGVRQEDLGGWSQGYSAFVDWRPSHRFFISLALDYQNRDGWLLHWDDRQFITFKAEDWQPKLEMDFFLTARQQLRITTQWAGIKAREQDVYLVPLRKGALEPVTKSPGAASDDFSISRLTFQFRYRWEIAPLSDLFVVYTRGSNVDSAPDEDFGTLLTDAWTEKIVDVFIVKLRYRLGS
ncbi:MAG: DUF5916 domain-containing protein [Gammaproteobacteria bacterium]|nr:DUF5916 domain-containing protein [Gammaproteobacteria bacterium]